MADDPPNSVDLERFEHLGLTEILQLQNALSRLLRKRFGANKALVFSDVVDSTPYFQQFGDEAGRRLLERHNSAVRRVTAAHNGWIVDTAGDGVFHCYDRVQDAAEALIALQERIAVDNASFSSEHQIGVRGSVHWGSVLTDQSIVTGDAVNVSARINGLAQAAEIRVSRVAFDELPNELRLRCGASQRSTLKGVTEPIRTLRLEWRDRSRFPIAVQVAETGELLLLPADKDLIRFGRIAEHNGAPANEIVLALPDPRATKHISRWHFELRRLPAGFVLRRVSRSGLTVDGVEVPQGQDIGITPNTVVRVADVVTLTFSKGGSDDGLDGATLGPEGLSSIDTPFG